MARMFKPVAPGPTDNKKAAPAKEQKDGKKKKPSGKGAEAAQDGRED